jgi:hypothetical protein
MRSKAILITLLVISALTGLGQTYASSKPISQNQNRREQEISALRLLGKAGKGKMKNTCSSLSAGLGTQGIIRKWLEDTNYAMRLHETAKKVANEGRDCSAQSIYFPIEQPQPIDKIVELLGKQDSTKTGEVTLNDKTRSLTWYEYGWLAFGVEDGKVTVIQIDFKKSGF